MAGRGGGRGGGRGAGGGGRGGRGGGSTARRVMVVAPPAATKSNAKTLDARFTMLNQKNAKRAEQLQRGTTARYAATMAKRTGKDAKKFAVSDMIPGERREERSRPTAVRDRNDPEF